MQASFEAQSAAASFEQGASARFQTSANSTRSTSVAKRRPLAIRIGVVADRARQPAQPLHIQLVLAAELQHFRPRHPAHPVVVRQLQFPAAGFRSPGGETRR
jgi:hypothetical protein